MLSFKHFFLLLTNTKSMKTVLIIFAVLIVLVTVSLKVTVALEYDIYKNLGTIKISVYGITIFCGDISLIAGYFNLIRKNKKVLQIKINLDTKSIQFVRNISENIKQKIYLTDFETDFDIASTSAMQVSVLAGDLIIVNDYVASRLLAENAETEIRGSVNVGYLKEHLSASIKATIFVCLFDAVWAVGKAMWQRSMYGKI